MTDLRGVMLDTSFVIWLMKEGGLHGNAAGYFRYFARHGVRMWLSAIVVSEYAAAEDPDTLLGIGAFEYADFGYAEAKLSGRFHSLLRGDLGTGEAGSRAVAINDLKILAHAAVLGADAVITADRRMAAKMIAPLRAMGVLDMAHLDLSVPPDVFLRGQAGPLR